MDTGIEIIATISKKTFGISWDASTFFIERKINNNTILVIGRKSSEMPTFQPFFKLCKMTIIITSTPESYSSNNEDTSRVYMTLSEANNFLMWYKQYKKVLILGGSSVYEHFVGIADKMYITQVEEKDYFDSFFPLQNMHMYEIEEVNNDYIIYNKTSKKHGEYVYLNLLKDIMENGNVRPDRTCVGTKSIFAPNPLKFDISKSIPILTTKFVSFKLIMKELLFFLKGQTDSAILERQGVNIWKYNSTREFLDERNLKNYKEGDIGPMYGWIWRFIGATYKGCDKRNETEGGFDQLNWLIKSLTTDPFSRRHMITTFCPNYVDQGCLPPCHGIICQFWVREDNGVMHLSCHVYNRSNDTFLGQPINIASYAILTHIIAKKCNMIPDQLTVSIGDCHLYLNHIEQANLQLMRDPLPFPILKINDSISSKKFEEFVLEDFELCGYLSHPAIKASMAI
jgi:thymidylate synthase